VDDEHVAEVPERHAVGDHARVGDLATVLIGAEAQRGLDDAVVLLACAPLRPIAVVAQERVDERAVDAVAVGGDLHPGQASRGAAGRRGRAPRRRGWSRSG
jgi:hypothetical protein